MSTVAGVALLVLLCPAFACAQKEGDEVGRLAEFHTVVESPPSNRLVEARDKPKHLKVGDVVKTREQTEGSGRARAFFLDQSVVQIGGNAELRVNEPYTPTGYRTAIELNEGKIRVLVSEGARCVVTTPSGEIYSHGTDFFVIVDPATKETTTIVVSGTVGVRGIGAPAGSEVLVHAYEMMRFAIDQPPSSPVVVSEATFDEYAADLDLIGEGVTERLPIARMIIQGELVPAEDLPTPWLSRTQWPAQVQQEMPGTIADPLFGVPGNLEVDF